MLTMHVCWWTQSCAGWSERYRDAICAAVHTHAPGGVSDILWRPMADILKQEGLEASHVQPCTLARCGLLVTFQRPCPNPKLPPR